MEVFRLWPVSSSLLGARLRAFRLLWNSVRVRRLARTDSFSSDISSFRWWVNRSCRRSQGAGFPAPFRLPIITHLREMNRLPNLPSVPLRICFQSCRPTHNPKVGGSNPPPATKFFIGLQAKLLLPAGTKRGIIGCFGGLFHFASRSAGRSTICTTLLLAARFDSIMASP